MLPKPRRMVPRRLQPAPLQRWLPLLITVLASPHPTSAAAWSSSSTATTYGTVGAAAVELSAWVVPSTVRVLLNATAPPPTGAKEPAWDAHAVSFDAARGESEAVAVAFTLVPSAVGVPAGVPAAAVAQVAVSMDRFAPAASEERRARRRQTRSQNSNGSSGGGGGTAPRGATVADAAALPLLSYSRVLAVPCSESAFYTLPPGEYPDALLPAASLPECGAAGVGTGAVRAGPGGAPGSGGGGSNTSKCLNVSVGTTHSLLVEVTVPSRTSPGNYSASLTLTLVLAGSRARAAGAKATTATTITAVTVPIALRVWNATVPSLLSSAMPTIMNFPFAADADGATDVGRYYGEPGNLSRGMTRAYFAALCASRTPPDLPYTPTGRPMADLTMAADPDECNGGAPRMALLNVQEAANASHAAQTSYSPEQLAAVVAALRPLVAAARANGYVYGFDEVTEAFLPGIRQLFGAVKAAFPDLRTIATLRWTPPDDLFELDTWDNLYSLWNDTAAAHWKAVALPNSSTTTASLPRETFAYWCISPRPPAAAPHYVLGRGWLNTFVEYPVVSARLLLWWAALRVGTASQVDGLLYYLADGWSAANGYRTLAVLPNSTATFSPVRPNGKLHGFSNGDGILLYPGPDGPAPSLRLANLRDGLEDYELFAQAAADAVLGPAGVHALVARLVRSGQDYAVDDDAAAAAAPTDVPAAVAMRGVRRQVLQALAAAAAATDDRRRRRTTTSDAE